MLDLHKRSSLLSCSVSDKLKKVSTTSTAEDPYNLDNELDEDIDIDTNFDDRSRYR